MNKNKKIIEKRDVIIVGGVLALMMVIGSIWDYPISLALHDASNPFGLFFAGYGEAPALLGLMMSGSMLFVARNCERKSIGYLQMLGGVVLILAGGAMLFVLPLRYVTLTTAVNAALTAAVTALMILVSIRLCRDANRSDVIKVAAAIFAVILLETVIVNIIKIPWGRPRMRLIATGAGAEFAPWWAIGGNVKRELMAAGVTADEFKSFPSAHTANGAVLMLLSLLPLLDHTLRQKRRLLFYIGAAWGGLVALSRVIMGAHFVTDTVVGFSLTLIIILFVINRMFERTQNTTSRYTALKRSGRTN